MVLEHRENDVHHLVGDMTQGHGVMVAPLSLTLIDRGKERIVGAKDRHFGGLHDGRAQVFTTPSRRASGADRFPPVPQADIDASGGHQLARPLPQLEVVNRPGVAGDSLL